MGRTRIQVLHVWLNNREDRQLEALFSHFHISSGPNRGAAFRALLDRLHAECVVSAKAPAFMPQVAPCNVHEVTFNHMEWLEDHFPGDRDLQLKVAELVKGFHWDWAHAIKRLKE
jgi:hypothetical protein